MRCAFLQNWSFGVFTPVLVVVAAVVVATVTLPPGVQNAVVALGAVLGLAGIAIAQVAKRLTTPTDRTDLLGKLQEGKDDEGNPMGREELTAEALTQLIAGSDTTSK